MRKYILILALAISALATNASAQYSNRKEIPWILRGFSAEVKVGPNIFHGDISDNNKVRFCGELTARREVLPILDIRTDIDGGVIAGEIDRYFWPASFKTNYYVWDLGVDYRFLNTGGKYYDKRLFEPYVGAGVGIMLFNPKTSAPYLDQYSDIAGFNVEGFTTTPMAFLDLGVRYFYDKNWGIRLETKLTVPFGNNSDKLDGHDSRYTDKDNGIILGEFNYDMIGSIVVGVSYKFYQSTFKTSSKYNRKTYLNNRRAYRRNAQRTRRR